jgi:hypothetical protein
VRTSSSATATATGQGNGSERSRSAGTWCGRWCGGELILDRHKYRVEHRDSVDRTLRDAHQVCAVSQVPPRTFLDYLRTLPRRGVRPPLD